MDRGDAVVERLVLRARCGRGHLTEARVPPSLRRRGTAIRQLSAEQAEGFH